MGAGNSAVRIDQGKHHSTIDSRVSLRELRWEQMVRFWPDYETYQARTERQIPIVKLVVEAVSLRENPTAPDSRT